MLATSPDESFRDGRKAVALATHACELNEWKNDMVLDTLAAAYAEAGDFNKAVEWQEKAFQMTTDTKNKHEYQDRLRLYKDKKPYRETE